MDLNADRFAEAVTDLRRHLNTCIPGGRLLRKDGASAWITGIPYAGYNSVWLERPTPPESGRSGGRGASPSVSSAARGTAAREGGRHRLRRSGRDAPGQ